MLLPASVLLSLSAAVVYASDLDTCLGSPHMIERSTAVTICPSRATCADEWNVERNWYNGTACKEQRIIVHCKCPGNDPNDPTRGSRQCPIGNEAHMLYANTKHRYYTCKPKCDISLCLTSRQAAREMVQGSPEFNRYNYYRILCRCPGHDSPIRSSRRWLSRTTAYRRLVIDRHLRPRVVRVQYRCSKRVTGIDVCRSKRSIPQP